MAKRKHGAKSAAIRQYLEANPNAKPKEVVEALKAKRLSVSAQMVSVLRGKQKRGPGRDRQKAITNGQADIKSLLQAKKMVESLGGMEQARRALSTLAQLLDS